MLLSGRGLEANMIGTGVFTTTGLLAGDLGRPSLVLGIWLAGALRRRPANIYQGKSIVGVLTIRA